MKDFFDAQTAAAGKGLLGISATTTGFYISILPKVEAWLRLISLLVGIAVGVASLVSILRNKRKP